MGDDTGNRDRTSQAASDPLYGAPAPSSSAPAGPTPAPSSDIQSTPASLAAGPTTNPLFGATPGPATSRDTTRSTAAGAPPIPHRSARLPLHHPSPLPSYLRRLGYILSLVLGSSAVIAGIWSIFLLPLLHASFSARKALVEQQQDRWTDMVSRIRAIRQGRLYDNDKVEEGVVVPGRKDDVASASGSEADREEARLVDHADSDTGKEELQQQLLPLKPISSLSATLADLASGLSSTSTTRTSLLSTLESYTSYLHRQVYLRSQPLSAGSRYGLGTLSANLAKAGGGGGSGAGRWPYDKEDDASGGGGLEAAGVKSEEWDAVRKEVRAIKGMLLSRRNFAPVAESETR